MESASQDNLGESGRQMLNPESEARVTGEGAGISGSAVLPIAEHVRGGCHRTRGASARKVCRRSWSRKYRYDADMH